jgi:excisionase family DNA binding protein
MKNDNRLAYGVKDAAEKIGISASKLWAMIANREISCVRLGGRTLITVRELSRLLGTPVPSSPGDAS